MTNAEIREKLRRKLSVELAEDLSADSESISFMALGVDSVIGTELIEFIRKEFAADTSVSVLFDHPSIQAVANYLESRVKPAVVGVGLRKVSANEDAIAIIGLSGRFPGANNAEELWKNLARGHCAITPIPENRKHFWDLANLGTNSERPCECGGFLDGVDLFDAEFFGISPKEAMVTDPQQRIFLEEAWKAIEDAAYSAEALANSRCGVYAGVMNTDYQDLLTHARALKPDVYELLGSAGSILAARIAYHLNLRGPAVAFDTACSSSLLAIHFACRALIQGEVDLALAGGVTLYLTQKRYHLMCQAGMLTSTGACRPFDDAADGTVPGEAAAILVLKRLKDAIRDRDAIHGVILGSGANQAGRTNGITAPSASSQYDLLSGLYTSRQIDPSTIDYVEAHGTGTRLGDPMEAEALSRAFGGVQSLARLGSVKANLGHTSAAAGAVGVIKVLQSLKNEAIAPQINFQTPNRHIPWEKTPFRINTTLERWPSGSTPRRAAVTALGFSGTNTHVILEEALPLQRAHTTEGALRLIVLSAKTSEALATKAQDLAVWLANETCALDDLSFSLSVGRSVFEYRLAFVAKDLAEVKRRLQSFVDGLPCAGVHVGHAPPARDDLHAVLNASQDELAQEWVRGASVNWSALFNGSTPSRLHLPVYPLARTRFWYDDPQGPPITSSPLNVAAPERPAADAKEKVKLKGLSTQRPPVVASALPSPVPTPRTKTPSEEIRKTQPVVNQEEISKRINAAVAGALYLGDRKLDKDKKFADLGLDSILAVELAKRISKEFGLNFSAAALYDHPTPDQLAKHVGKVLSGKAVVLEKEEARYFAPILPDKGRIGVNASSKPASVETPLVQKVASGDTTPGSAKRWIISESGDLSDLRFSSELTLPGPAAHELQVEVEATSVMLADLLCVRGLYPTMPAYPFTPGFEFAGLVRSAGTDASAFAPGDRVFGLTGQNLGGHAAVLNVDARLVVRMPPELSFREAATLPVAFLTAHYALNVIGRLAAGESILIHSAASCTGLMAIQLAHRIGAMVYATVGSPAKIEALRERGVEHVWCYEHEGHLAELQAALPDGKVDVILNLLSGNIRDDSLNLLAPGGRFLDLAVGGLKAVAPVDLSALVDSQGYFGIDCRRVSQRQPAKVQEWLTNLTDRLSAAEIEPLPVHAQFCFSEAAQAYAEVQSRRSVGRVVLVKDPEMMPSQALGSNLPSSSSARAGFVPIAIIGLAGRFPNAKTAPDLWNNLLAGQSAIQKVPPDRWPHLEPHSKEWWGGLVDGHDEFDAPFFKIARAEAEQMDPQHRLFFQEAWHALEDAGYAPKSLAGVQGGIFVGIGPSEYYSALPPSAHTLPGNLGSGLTGRLAYWLDWTGPCLAVETACSSSFSAIHLACSSLAQAECEIAMAGGVHVAGGPKVFAATSSMGLLSPTGQCRTLDAAADGWVIGEAVGAVILKRLDDAVREGDHVYAVIRGWGINQDGAKNGFTSPKAASQAALQKRVYERAGIKPETIDYLEIHGISTVLGDEVELSALSESFNGSKRIAQCALGTLKPNIGHPIAAAGISCLIKTALALRSRKLPPMPGVQNLNAGIALQDSPFAISRLTKEWPAKRGEPRRAAINGLSASGTNCHLVLEEFIEAPRAPVPDAKALILLSGRNSTALKKMAAQLEEFLLKNKVMLSDLAYTLHAGRDPMEERFAFAASSIEEVREKLRAFASSETGNGLATENISRAGSITESLVSGEEGRQFVAAAIRNGSYEKLAHLWVNGIDLPWEPLFAGKSAQRISLPGYPFAPEKYWIGIDPTPRTTIQDSQKHHGTIHALREILARALKIEPTELSSDRDLADYGFDSLYALKAIEGMQVAFAKKIGSRVLFENRTITAIAEALEKIPATAAQEPLPGLERFGKKFPLSEGQKALWSIHRADPAALAYQVPVAFWWKGRVEPPAFEAAWKRLLEEHAALRSWVCEDGMQSVDALRVDVRSDTVLSGCSENRILDHLQPFISRPFDLTTPPLCRATLFPAKDERTLVLLVFHHLVLDGRSLALIMEQLERNYREQPDTATAIKTSRPEYSDFVQSEIKYLTSPQFEEDRKFWLKRFPEGIHSAPLGKDAASSKGAVSQHAVPQEVVRKLTALARSENATAQSVFLAAFQCLLAMQSRTPSVTTAIACDLRPASDYENVVGYFVNMLPITTTVSPTGSFRDVLKSVFPALLDSFDHRRFPFRQLARALTDSGKTQNLRHAFYFQTWKSPEHRRILHKFLPGVHQTGEFDLVFEVIEGEGDWLLNVKYRVDSFEINEIRSLVESYFALLGKIGTDASAALATPSDETSNDASFAYPSRCTHQLISEQMRQTPENIAVVFEGEKFSYSTLEARANQIAHFLAASGVSPASLVGVMLPRSFEMLAALLAVWKAGAAYVPLDPSYPDERLSYILKDSGAAMLLCDKIGFSLPSQCRAVNLTQVVREIDQCSETNPAVSSSVDDLAYVIYTSGSTGEPKGVQIGHRSLTHFLWCMKARLRCSEKDHALALTTICFDIAALELFLPLICGGRTEVLPEETARNGFLLRKRIEQSAPNLVQATPAGWKMLLTAGLGICPGMKALCGGEAWNSELASQLISKVSELWNMYGPTETTVWSSAQQVGSDHAVHLGDPLGNTRFYVLDENLKPVNRGEVGELFIGGDGLAKGYLNRPELTKERFLPHPDRENEIIYRTGDLIRYV